jgi:hypothetical protein
MEKLLTPPTEVHSSLDKKEEEMSIKIAAVKFTSHHGGTAY